MTSLVTFNHFLVSKSNTTQIKEILSFRKKRKRLPQLLAVARVPRTLRYESFEQYINMNSNCIKRLNKTKSAKLYVHRKFCFALQVPFDTMLLLLCLWEGEFYQKGQTLGPARVVRHDKVWACNVLYQTWQPLWPSGQTSGFFPHPTLLYRTNTSLHYSHHLNLTGETISAQPHSSWWCVCVCVV